MEYHLENIDNIEDYKKYRAKLSKKKTDWGEEVKQIKDDLGYKTNKDFADRCGVTSQTVGNWLRKKTVPSSRDVLIRIGMLAGYDVVRMNGFLEKYGFGRLYSKNVSDAVYIFVLENSEKFPDKNYQDCQKIIDNINFKKDRFKDEKTISKPTEEITEGIKNVSDFPELIEFINSNAAAFKSRYYKFYEYMQNFMNQNIISDGKKDTIHKLVEQCGWPRSFQKIAYGIQNKDWIPDRWKLISLCLRLNMKLDEVNSALILAKMKDLSEKSLLDSAIIFVLIDASLNDEIHKDGSDVLCIKMLEIMDNFDDMDDIDEIKKDLLKKCNHIWR